MSARRSENIKSTIKKRQSGRFLKTPYSTVRRRKIHLSRRLLDLSAETSSTTNASEKSKQFFKKFTKTIRRTYYSTPLYKFHKDNKSLKRYSQYLTCHIAAEKQKNFAFANEENEDFDLIVEIIAQDIFNDGNNPIEIFVRSGKQKVLSHVVFCCLDSFHKDDVLQQILPPYICPNEDHKQTLTKEFTWLPLVLANGLVSYQNMIINWMKVNFDCKISPLRYNPMELSWMVSMWSSIGDENSNRNTKFVWQIPKNEGLNKMTVSLPQDSIQELWKRCRTRNKTSSHLTSEEKEKFITSLEDHLTSVFKVKVAALPLIEIDTSFASVKFDGKIKILKEDHVHTVLSHLTCLCIERLGIAIN